MATPLVIGRDHYMNRSLTSVLVAQVTVTDTAATLLSLLAEVTEDLTGEDTGCSPTPNGAYTHFSGVIELLAHTQILDDSSVTFTATVGALPVLITDNGAGVLTGADVTGTIDYETGVWTLTWSTGVPDDATDITVDYTYYYVFGATEIRGVWLSPATDIRATFDGVTAPTETTGTILKGGQALFLTEQPILIGKMQLISGGSVVVDVEVMI